ncbi:DUF1642 domain-containing protein [Listeria phage LP-032]|uniref:DUF1642 domain protein n=8 Tax=Homburgvirus TaxID=1921125 RepID=A0A6C0QZZ8_9CAUD|nr:DUF1642 domain protein [Listeria phage LP-037]YP_009044150.1 DUF1642 domain-containing protein [Listeria phage LP-026]YP_009045120.1 DUF1642 domain-containing protein [Listeria phage LP-114]AHL18949.1 DUF1642 domain-containing protein [Listeria phage LP-032]QDK04588.1 hypothetical protein FK481_0074 [Listeria phage LP-010]QDK04698.1 hypothetical protein FK482_0076 [Listeria phage LP-013]QDK04807.1 hypothetical protein FK484_0074 [Listeria phage LP-031]QHZ59419.1 DUF1642 domain protein [Li
MELPVIPKSVAKLLEWGEILGYDLVDLFSTVDKKGMIDEADEWILNSKENQYALAKAWACGYILEEEEL